MTPDAGTQIISNGPAANGSRPEGIVAPIDGHNFSELGNTGLKRANRYLYEEYLPALSGAKANKVFMEMRDNDPVVGGILFAIDMLLRGVKWRVEPGDQTEEGKAGQQFVEECLEDMSQTWSETVSEILTMLPYGYSFHEIVYKKRVGPGEEDPRKRSRYSDGKIGWRKIPIRSQDTTNGWEFDVDGGVKGMYQLAPPDYKDVFIPISKALLFRPTSYKSNPEGRSILRNAYRPWYFKKRIEEIEGIGIERDLAGLPVAFVDPAILSPDATASEAAILAGITSLVKNVRRDTQEGVIFPRVYDEQGHSLYDFTLMSTGGNRQFDTNQIVQRYDQRIAITVLGDFVLLGHERVGSFALSSDKTDLFAVALGAWLDMIADVFNRYAIPRLMLVNGMDIETLPSLQHGDIESPDLSALADYVTKLAAAGVPLFPDPELEDYLREVAHLPEKADDLKELDAQVATVERQTVLAQREQQADMARNPEKYADMFGGAVAPGRNGDPIGYQQRMLPRKKPGATDPATDAPKKK